jgi:hypothetical protein
MCKANEGKAAESCADLPIAPRVDGGTVSCTGDGRMANMLTSTRTIGLAAVLWLASSEPPQDPVRPQDTSPPAEKALHASLIDRGMVIMLNRSTLAVVDIAEACDAIAKKCLERARVAQSDCEAQRLHDLAGTLGSRKDAAVALAIRLDVAVSDYESTTCQRRSGGVPLPGWRDVAFDDAVAAMRQALQDAKQDYDQLRGAVDECGLALPRWPKVD